MSARGPERRGSASRDDWETPPALYAAVDREFGFKVDLAANEVNHKAKLWLEGPCSGEPNCLCGLHGKLAVSIDYLGKATYEVVWCNPPYGLGLGAWVERFVALAAEGHTVVALLGASSFETAWASRVVETADEIRLLSPRVGFIHSPECGCKACLKSERPSNTGGSMLAIWRAVVPGLSTGGARFRTWRWQEGRASEDGQAAMFAEEVGG